MYSKALNYFVLGAAGLYFIDSVQSNAFGNSSWFFEKDNHDQQPHPELIRRVQRIIADMNLGDTTVTINKKGTYVGHIKIVDSETEESRGRMGMVYGPWSPLIYVNNGSNDFTIAHELAHLKQDNQFHTIALAAAYLCIHPFLRSSIRAIGCLLVLYIAHFNSYLAEKEADISAIKHTSDLSLSIARTYFLCGAMNSRSRKHEQWQKDYVHKFINFTIYDEDGHPRFDPHLSDIRRVQLCDMELNRRSTDSKYLSHPPKLVTKDKDGIEELVESICNEL